MARHRLAQAVCERVDAEPSDAAGAEPFEPLGYAGSELDGVAGYDVGA
jgi:hypothetical protein